MRRRSAGSNEPEVASEQADPALRGSTANLGDRVHVTATSRDRYRAIWVYRGDRQLVVACPAGPSCNGSGDTLTADFTLQFFGRYFVLAVASRTPLPEPAGSLDLDRATAENAGAWTKDWPLDVR